MEYIFTLGKNLPAFSAQISHMGFLKAQNLNYLYIVRERIFSHRGSFLFLLTVHMTKLRDILHFHLFYKWLIKEPCNLIGWQHEHACPQSKENIGLNIFVFWLCPHAKNQRDHVFPSGDIADRNIFELSIFFPKFVSTHIQKIKPINFFVLKI